MHILLLLVIFGPIANISMTTQLMNKATAATIAGSILNKIIEKCCKFVEVLLFLLVARCKH